MLGRVWTELDQLFVEDTKGFFFPFSGTSLNSEGI